MEQRILKLEKSNKRLRKYLISLHCIIAIALLYGFQDTKNVFDVIETNKLIVKDKQGKERAVLLVDTLPNSVKLRFKDTSGKNLTSLGIHESNGYYGIWGKESVIFHVTDRNDGGRVYLSKDDSTDIRAIHMGYDNKKNLGYIGIYGNETVVFYASENSYGDKAMNGGFLIISADDSLRSKNIVLEADTANTRVLIKDSFQKTYLNHFGLKIESISGYGYSFGQDFSYKEPGLLNELEYPLLTTYEDRHAGINIFDGDISFRAGVMPSKYSYLKLVNENSSINFMNHNNSIGTFINDEENNKYELIYNKNNKNLSTYYYDAYGNLRISLGNQGLRNSNGRSYTTPLSSINLFNEQGTSIFSAP